VRLVTAFCLCVAITLSLAPAWSGPDVRVVGDTTSTEVTVYNDNLGLVKDRRSVDLIAGRNVVELIGIPAQIDASSLALKSLTDPTGFRIIEQNYQYDLVDKNKLLSKYIGKRVWFRFRNEGDKKVKEEPPKEKKDDAGQGGKTPFDQSVQPTSVGGADDSWTPPLLGNDERYDRFVSGILMLSGASTSSLWTMAGSYSTPAAARAAEPAGGAAPQADAGVEGGHRSRRQA